MLFKRPLDLVGDMAENRVVGEYHPLTQLSDRAFTVELGSFYSSTVAIRNATTGQALVRNVDYKLLNADMAAVTETGGKAVDTVIFMLDTNMSGVYVDYQAVGGQYSVLSLAVVILLEANKNATKEPIYWSDILDKPETWLPTNHTHELWELDEIEKGHTALTKVIESILLKDYEGYREVFDSLYNKIKTTVADAEDSITQLTADVRRLKERSTYLPGDVIIGDFANNPEEYYPECKWLLLPNTFLYGNSSNVATDPETITIANGEGIVARNTHIYVALPKDPIVIELTSSATTVNEGDSFTITVVARSGLVAGVPIKYTITGVQSEDIDIPLTGELILDNALSAVLDVNVIADNLTEGVQALVFTLDDYDQAIVITINDTSLAPAYSMFFSKDADGVYTISTANEGDRVYLQVRSVNAPVNETVNLFYGGNAGQDDFTSTLFSRIDLLLNKATMVMDIKADNLTEVKETLIAYMSLTDQESSLVSAVLEINDTSKTQVIELSYRTRSINWETTPAITQAKEGDQLYAVVHALNVPDGTVMAIQYGGDAKSDDFVGERPNSVIIENEVGYIPLTIREDLLTEGTESLITNIFLNGLIVASAELLILDTSFGVDTRVRFSNNSIGSNTILMIKEGERFYLIIAAPTNVPDYTTFNLGYEGTATEDDFAAPRPTVVNILGGRAVVEFETKADMISEGDEYMRVRVYDSRDSSEMGSANIQIVDTSRAPTFEVFYTLDPNTDVAINQANEGDIVWLVCKTEYIPNGTILNVEQSINGRLAVVGNGDVVIDPQTTMMISNGRGAVSLQIANDRVTDGNKPLVGIIRQGGIEVGRRQITIIDTSVAEWFNITFSSTPDGSPITRPLKTGESLYLNISVAGVTNATTYYLKYVGSAGNFEGLPNSIDVTQQAQSFTYPITFRDKLILADYTLKANLYNDPASQFPLATSNEINVLGIVTDVKFSRLASGNDAQTLFLTGDLIYVHCRATNVLDGKTIPLYVTVDGRLATKANGYVTTDVVRSVTITNGMGVFTIATANPSPVMGDTIIRVAYADKDYDATLMTR